MKSFSIEKGKNNDVWFKLEVLFFVSEKIDCAHMIIDYYILSWYLKAICKVY